MSRAESKPGDEAKKYKKYERAGSKAKGSEPPVAQQGGARRLHGLLGAETNATRELARPFLGRERCRAPERRKLIRAAAALAAGSHFGRGRRARLRLDAQFRRVVPLEVDGRLMGTVTVLRTDVEAAAGRAVGLGLGGPPDAAQRLLELGELLRAGRGRQLRLPWLRHRRLSGCGCVGLRCQLAAARLAEDGARDPFLDAEAGGAGGRFGAGKRRRVEILEREGGARGHQPILLLRLSNIARNVNRVNPARAPNRCSA